MSSTRRRPPVGHTETVLLWVGIGTVVVVVGAVYGAVQLGSRMSGSGPVPGNPFDLVFGLLRGSVRWPAAATWVLVAIVVLLVALLIVGLLVRRAMVGGRGSRVDAAARHLGRGRDIAALTDKGVAATASRLGVQGPDGVTIGRTVAGNRLVRASWEDTQIDIWGPRTGKTTSRAVPAILDAPGAVFVTSNKRDVVDATRELRARRGEVWVFDPQGVCGEQPDWWWNPLSYVTDEVKAAQLAEHFASGSRDLNARTDAFFDPAGQDLLAGLLLAAALDRRPITDVYSWLTRPTDETPADLLRDHGVSLIADRVVGVITAPDKQRGGIYGTAQQMASCLTSRQVLRWVTPEIGGTRDRVAFDPYAFVQGGGTLYSLSREGRGTAGPLVTALTVAVAEAAEELAMRSSGGRLAVPLLGVLDEAANVCRWRELPNLYSHFGSRGIVLMTILQSWSQGADVWGEAGIKKLWSAANVKVYGGGVDEQAFLDHLSAVVGDYDRHDDSATWDRGRRSVTHRYSAERILAVSDLAAMPRGRALVLSSGSKPTLVKTLPWMEGPHAAAVRASIAAHDPQAVSPLGTVEPVALTAGEERA